MPKLFDFNRIEDNHVRAGAGGGRLEEIQYRMVQQVGSKYQQTVISSVTEFQPTLIITSK
jgi:hypothetical protein